MDDEDSLTQQYMQKLGREKTSLGIELGLYEKALFFKLGKGIVLKNPTEGCLFRAQGVVSDVYFTSEYERNLRAGLWLGKFSEVSKPAPGKMLYEGDGGLDGFAIRGSVAFIPNPYALVCSEDPTYRVHQDLRGVEMTLRGREYYYSFHCDQNRYNPDQVDRWLGTSHQSYFLDTAGVVQDIGICPYVPTGFRFYLPLVGNEKPFSETGDVFDTPGDSTWMSRVRGREDVAEKTGTEVIDVTAYSAFFVCLNSLRVEKEENVQSGYKMMEVIGGGGDSLYWNCGDYKGHVDPYIPGGSISTQCGSAYSFKFSSMEHYNYNRLWLALKVRMKDSQYPELRIGIRGVWRRVWVGMYFCRVTISSLSQLGVYLKKFVFKENLAFSPVAIHLSSEWGEWEISLAPQPVLKIIKEERVSKQLQIIVKACFGGVPLFSYLFGKGQSENYLKVVHSGIGCPGEECNCSYIEGYGEGICKGWRIRSSRGKRTNAEMIRSILKDFARKFWLDGDRVAIKSSKKLCL